MKSVLLLLVGLPLAGCVSSPGYLAQFEERVRNDVARGYDFNQRNAEGQTLLHEVAMISHVGTVDTAVVRILLEAGADPTLADNAGNTPLHLLDEVAILDRRKAQVAYAALLLEYGADPIARNHAAETPLHRTWNDGVALLLVEAGADPNAQDNAGDTPLHRWSWIGSRTDDVVPALLAAGADPNVRNGAGETPLHEAAGPYGYGMNYWEEVTPTPLHAPARRNIRNYVEHTKVAHPQARLLLLAGAEVDAADTLGRTPLHVAASSGSPVHRVLLANGADPNARDRNGRTPVHGYAGHFHWVRQSYSGSDTLNLYVSVPDEFLDPLIAAGADVNAPDRLGRRPLHLAHDLLVISALLDAGASLAARDSTGATPLHMATASMNETRMTALLGLGASSTARDTLGATPLHYLARESGSKAGTSAADILLRAGADLNARDHSGKTPLHLAAALMNETRMTALLGLGAYATARDTLGATPLHYLAKESGPETGTGAADILLRAGADPNARDATGKMPLDYIEHRSPLWWRLNDLRGRGIAP